MTDSNAHRSQAILRMPVDHVDATMILHDGERSEVILLLSPGDHAADVMVGGDEFLPVMRDAKICLVARDAIAALGLQRRPLTTLEEEMPHETQRATIKLRSGMMLEGELRWPLVDGKRRTVDYLKSSPRYIELRAQDKSWFVAKAHLAYVQEM